MCWSCGPHCRPCRSARASCRELFQPIRQRKRIGTWGLLRPARRWSALRDDRISHSIALTPSACSDNGWKSGSNRFPAAGQGYGFQVDPSSSRPRAAWCE